MNDIMGISRYRKIQGWTDTQLDAMRDEAMLLRKDRRVKQLAMENDMPIDRFWREVGALIGLIVQVGESACRSHAGDSPL